MRDYSKCRASVIMNPLEFKPSSSRGKYSCHEIGGKKRPKQIRKRYKDLYASDPETVFVSHFERTLCVPGQVISEVISSASKSAEAEQIRGILHAHKLRKITTIFQGKPSARRMKSEL